MIFRDSHAYMAKTLNGAPQVIEMGDMIQTFGAMLGEMNGGLVSVLTKDQQIDSLTPSSVRKTIADIKGGV